MNEAGLTTGSGAGGGGRIMGQMLVSTTVAVGDLKFWGCIFSMTNNLH